MSDKLKQDFDLYYKELENFTGNFKASSQKVETDKMLSRAGKFEQVEKLKGEHFKNVDELRGRFTKDFEGRQKRIGDILNGKKKNADLDSIKRRFSKGEDLSTDQQNRLIIHGLAENKQLMAKKQFSKYVSQCGY